MRLKTIITIIKIVLSIVLLVYLINKAIRTEQFAGLLSRDKNYLALFAAATACVGAHFVGFYRWHGLARAVGLPMSLRDACRISLIGSFFGLVAFGVVGTDSLRAYYAARQSVGRRMEAVASVFVDRLIGLLTMFLFALAGYFWADWRTQQPLAAGVNQPIQVIQWIVLIAGICAVAGIGLLVALLTMPGLRRFAWYKRLTQIPVGGRLLHRLTGVAALYRYHWPRLVTAFGMSCLVNLGFMISIFFAADFVSANHPSLLDHLIIAPLSMVANALPLPGGLGGMEMVLDFLYQTYARSQGQPEYGVVVAFVYRLLLLIVAALGAISWFAMSPSARQEINQQNQSS